MLARVAVEVPEEEVDAEVAVSCLPTSFIPLFTYVKAALGRGNLHDTS